MNYKPNFTLEILEYYGIFQNIPVEKYSWAVLYIYHAEEKININPLNLLKMIWFCYNIHFP